VRLASKRSRDASLLMALRSGEPGAVHALWTQFSPLVYRILHRMVGRGPDSDDLAQDVFLTVLRRLPSLRDPSSVGPFISSIAMFTARTQYRGRLVSRRRERWIREISHPPFVTNDVEAREGLVRFATIVFHLRPHERSVFALRIIEGKRIEDVASALGVSMATVKRRLKRARDRVASLAELDPVLCGYVRRQA
jgi:RNA polymerase sigma-70 factor (ECF subfamily)